MQRNRGAEFTVFGEPVAGIRLLGGIAFIDAELVRTLGGQFDGNAAPGVPDMAINLYGEYDLPPWLAPGLTLTGRAIHTSRQFYNQANTQSVPDWTRFDAGLRYAFEGVSANPWCCGPPSRTCSTIRTGPPPHAASSPSAHPEPSSSPPPSISRGRALCSTRRRVGTSGNVYEACKPSGGRSRIRSAPRDR